MGADDGPADRQPHPDAAGLGRVEGLEDAIEVPRIDTGPGVVHTHHNAVRRLATVDRQGAASGERGSY